MVCDIILMVYHQAQIMLWIPGDTVDAIDIIFISSHTTCDTDLRTWCHTQASVKRDRRDNGPEEAARKLKQQALEEERTQQFIHYYKV